MEANLVTWNALISGFASNGLLDDAFKLFEQMKEEEIDPDIVTWTALISGYISHGQVDRAFELLQEMRKQKIEPGLRKQALQYLREIQ